MLKPILRKYLFVPLSIVAILILMSQTVVFQDQHSVLNIVQTVAFRDQHSELNIVQKEDLPTIGDQIRTCSRSYLYNKIFDFSWLICSKDKNEAMSNTYADTEFGFEPWSTFLMFQVMHIFPHAALLDIGSNLGYYSLLAAKLKHRVYAVDPVIENLAYVRAGAELGGYEKRITLINNAISEDKSELIPWSKEELNDGMVSMITKEEFNQLSSKEKARALKPIVSVTLEEVLEYTQEDEIMIKIDVEGYECKILNNYLISENKTKYVPLLLIEWSKIRLNENGWCPNLDQLLQNFASAGYKIYKEDDIFRTIKNPLPKADKDSKDDNVVFIHHDAVKRILNFDPQNIVNSYS